MYGANIPDLPEPRFLMNQNFANILQQDGQDGPGSLTWIFEITLANFSFLLLPEKNLQEFLCVSTVQVAPHSPCSLTDQNSTNNFWKGALMEHFYEIISNSDQYCQRRTFFRIFFVFV